MKRILEKKLAFQSLIKFTKLAKLILMNKKIQQQYLSTILIAGTLHIGGTIF
jgi:hypothetical protein